MNMPRADSQQEKSLYATLIIVCLFAGLPGNDLHTHTHPCMGGDKTEDALTFSCHCPHHRCWRCVYHTCVFFVSLDRALFEPGIKQSQRMRWLSPSLIFTRSLPVSVLKKTIIFHLFILNALSEKKDISSPEENPESEEIAQYEFKDKKIN